MVHGHDRNLKGKTLVATAADTTGLAELMRVRRMSQRGLAALADIDVETARRAVKGKPVQLGTARRIAGVLATEPVALFGPRDGNGLTRARSLS